MGVSLDTSVCNFIYTYELYSKVMKSNGEILPLYGQSGVVYAQSFFFCLNLQFTFSASLNN